MSDSLLYTARDGAPDGAPFLILHDRFGSLEDAQSLGEALGPQVLRIAVRAPRLQTSGSLSNVVGHYWYFGPIEKPELSTLGDGLYQLERLLLETIERTGHDRIGLYGKGEGGVVALLMALIWPEHVASVTAIEAPLPANLGAIPIELKPLGGMPVRLVNADAATATRLAELGATVTPAA